MGEDVGFALDFPETLWGLEDARGGEGRAGCKYVAGV